MLTVRPAHTADRWRLNQLLGSDAKIHTHLDWRPPEAWLGKKPFHLMFAGKVAVAVLAAPPDPPDTAWLRLAAVVEEFETDEMLDELWGITKDVLIELNAATAACMLMGNWLTPHLQRWQFAQVNDVVTLCRTSDSHSHAKRPKPPHSLKIRDARSSDLKAMFAVDAAAFEPPWQYSVAALREALSHAATATAAEAEGQLVGFQISTAGSHNAHLARLAVLPGWQGRGIGRALLSGLVDHFDSAGTPMITVNTQHDNAASLKLYQLFGFENTGEHFPVWEYNLTMG